MKIQYKPRNGIRLITEMGILMDASNDWTQDIPSQDNVLFLLTYPDATFSVSAAEAVSVAGGSAATLVDLGIMDADQLAGAGERAQEIAVKCGVEIEVVQGWIAHARDHINKQSED